GYSLLFSLGNQLQQLITLPMGDCGLLKIWSTLSDCYVHIQKLLNSLKVGDPLTGIETLRSGISFHNDLQSVMSRLSDDITSILAYRNTLSDSTQSLQSIVNELALKDDIQAIIKIIGSLTEQSVCRPSCTLELFLNSIPIMNNITDCSITIGRDTVFDVIQLSSTDSRFFSKVNNSSEWPSLGIEAIYQGTSWSFLVEEVTGNERSFSIWGRSFAAKKSAEPFKKETTYVVESDQLASDLADDLIPELAISWQVVDWLITDGYTVTGTPIEMLKELAASVGAVVRATPDGTGLQVAHKFPIRPVNLQSATSVDSFDRETNITLLDLSCIHGDASNSVVVYGQSLVDQFSLIFEAEESCVVVDQLAYLRVYPAMSGAGYLLASTGLAPTYESAHMEDYDEVVYFITGKASVSRPIKELISIEWDGLVPVGGYTWTVGSSNVVLNSGGIAVGRIKYKTSYDRWSVGHVGLGDLLVVLFQDKDSGTTARVYFGAGDREAESISRPNLTSLEAAIEAGKAWLDDNSYNKLKCALKTPCVNLMDGQIVSLESVPSGVEGNWLVFRHVISASIVDNTRKVWSNLDVVQFEQP
ncbi:MAG: hypothetical protein U9R60_16310, partial [Bacteroidota bacterium]|nr:hypothetical protein [Bacteroidota bacterium]